MRNFVLIMMYEIEIKENILNLRRSVLVLFSLTRRFSLVVFKIPAPPEAKLTPFTYMPPGRARYGGAVGNPNFSAVVVSNP